jgi:hypothetical protein
MRKIAIVLVLAFLAGCGVPGWRRDESARLRDQLSRWEALCDRASEAKRACDAIERESVRDAYREEWDAILRPALVARVVVALLDLRPRDEPDPRVEEYEALCRLYERRVDGLAAEQSAHLRRD